MVAGLVRGLYVPTISTGRPLRARAFSMTTMRYCGCLRAPVRESRIINTRRISLFRKSPARSRQTLIMPELSWIGKRVCPLTIPLHGRSNAVPGRTRLPGDSHDQQPRYCPVRDFDVVVLGCRCAKTSCIKSFFSARSERHNHYLQGLPRRRTKFWKRFSLVGGQRVNLYGNADAEQHLLVKSGTGGV